jgi:septal ring factor EnvC (AmiA/AmiB activator)
MNALLAVTAFLMALGAVFLANDAIRKVEHKNEEFIKNHVNRLKAAIEHNHSLLEELATALQIQGEQLSKDAVERLAIKEQLTKLEEEINKANAEITDLNAGSARRQPRKSA